MRGERWPRLMCLTMAFNSGDSSMSHAYPDVSMTRISSLVCRGTSMPVRTHFNLHPLLNFPPMKLSPRIPHRRSELILKSTELSAKTPLGPTIPNSFPPIITLKMRVPRPVHTGLPTLGPRILTDSLAAFPSSRKITSRLSVVTKTPEPLSWQTCLSMSRRADVAIAGTSTKVGSRRSLGIVFTTHRLAR